MNKRIFIYAILLIIPLNGMSQKLWYELKSGIINSRVNAGGIILEQKEYFDEWGSLVMIESIMGENEHRLCTRFIYGDKFMTMIKPECAEAIRYPRSRPRINWLHLDDVIEKAFDIHYLGRVQLKGYKCDLYKYKIKDCGRIEEVTNWVYKGVPIQYITVKNGITLQQEFLSIEENISFDKDIFIVPPEIEIIDNDSIQ